MKVAGEYELEQQRAQDRMEQALSATKSELHAVQQEKAAVHQQLANTQAELARAKSALQTAQASSTSTALSWQQEVVRLRFELAAVRTQGSQAPSATAVQAAIAAAQAELLQSGRIPREALDILHSEQGIAAAAHEGALDVLCEVLSPSAPVRAEDQAGDDSLALHNAGIEAALSTALRKIARRGPVAGNEDTVRMLMDLGANPHDIGTGAAGLIGRNTLHYAAQGNFEGLVRALLEELAFPVDSRDTLEHTPLMVAAAENAGAAAKLLLLHGADPHAQNFDGATISELAAAASAGSVLDLLNDASVMFWNASVRANRAYNQKQFDVAIAAYSDAIEKATDARVSSTPRDLATLHYNRARAAYRLGKHVAAIEDCSIALERDSSYRNALAQRAECYMSLFDFARATADFGQLLHDDPRDRQWERRKRDATMLRDLSHYAVLGIAADAKGSAVKRGYKQACLRWHPDKHCDNAEDQQRAKLAFQRVTKAYEVLSDEYKRMLYDMEQRTPGKAAAAPDVTLERWHAREAAREAERMREREELISASVQQEQTEAAERAARRQQLQVAAAASAAVPTPSPAREPPIPRASSPIVSPRMEQPPRGPLHPSATANVPAAPTLPSPLKPVGSAATEAADADTLSDGDLEALDDTLSDVALEELISHALEASRAEAATLGVDDEGDAADDWHDVDDMLTPEDIAVLKAQLRAGRQPASVTAPAAAI